MFSIKKPNFSRFATFILQVYFICVFQLFSIFSFASGNPVKIREFKYYREYSFDNGNLLVDKKKLDIFFTSKNGNLKIVNGLYGKISTFQGNDGRNDHFLVMAANGKKNKLGYFLRGNQKQYQSEICPTAVFSKNVDQIVAPELIEKINGLKITNLFDKESCKEISEEKFEEFKKILIGTLSAKQSSLQRCMKSEIARNIFLADQALLNNANEVFSRYLDLIASLSNKNIKLKCGMDKGDENKIASFNQNPLEIAINIIDKKFNLKIKNARAVLGHELMHFGSQQFKTAPKSTCLDEGFVQLFENVCTYADDTTQPKPKSSESIVKACLKSDNPQVEALALSNEEKSGDFGGEIVGAVGLATLENREQSKRGTEAVIAAANSSAAPIFESIPDSVVQLAANEHVSTSSGNSLSAYEGDGEFHTVVGDSSFTSSVRQLSQSLTNSVTNANRVLTTALGNTGMVVAAAAVGNTANAASSAGSSASAMTGFKYSPMTASEIFMNRYYPDSKEVQAAMNNQQLRGKTYDQIEDYYRSLGSKPSNTSTSVQLASDTGSGDKPTETKSANASTGVKNLKTAKAGGGTAPVSAGTAASRTVASLPTQTEGAPAASADEDYAKKAHTESSATKKGSQTAPVANPKIKLDNAILQRLTAFSKVNEPAYTRVTERFNDQTFRRQLDARKIRIIGENNKPLWVSSVQPQRCFRDNKTTKVLEVVACK